MIRDLTRKSVEDWRLEEEDQEDSIMKQDTQDFGRINSHAHASNEVGVKLEQTAKAQDEAEPAPITSSFQKLASARFWQKDKKMGRETQKRDELKKRRENFRSG